jgi:MFS family permease
MSFASVHFAAYVSDMHLDVMDHTIAGEVLGVSGAFSILGAVLMGKWSDRIGRRIPLGVTYTLRSLSFLVLLAFPDNPTMLFLFAVILGLSWTATTPLSSAVTADAWGRQSSGFLFGIIFTFMTVGSAVGSYLAGLDYDVMHNYTFAIIANATVAGLGALASFAIREGQHTTSETQAVTLPQPFSSTAGR